MVVCVWEATSVIFSTQKSDQLLVLCWSNIKLGRQVGSKYSVKFRESHRFLLFDGFVSTIKKAAFDNRESYIVYFEFIDLKRAFDTIKHNLLLDKLDRCDRYQVGLIELGKSFNSSWF